MAKRKYGRRSVEISNEDKVLFPKAKLTKGALIDYYEQRGVLKRVDGSLKPEEVGNRIRALLATLRMEEEL